MLPQRDVDLVQIVDSSLADAGRRAWKADGSSWLACMPGCTSCCHGVFRISRLDAERLRDAFQRLSAEDPQKAMEIHLRAEHVKRMLSKEFPGNPSTGVLSEEGEAWQRFADSPETDIACPVLDPGSGACMLYAARPLTCRIFGPPVQNETGIGMCELCYVGASESEILHGEMHLVHHNVERELDLELPSQETVIAWALLA